MVATAHPELSRQRAALECARAAHSTGEPRLGEHAPRPDIAASWDRCRSVLAIDHGTTVGVDDVADRWERSSIRRAGASLLDELGVLATAEDYVAAVVDLEGHIVWSAAGASMERAASRANFVPGARWDEGVAGTNAPGLALRTGRPSTVFAGEHWCTPVHDWVCYAAPVHAPNGGIAGVLDLSAAWHRASPLALTTVTSFARLIEHELQRLPVGDAGALDLRVLGHPSSTLGDDPLRLTQRQLEILTVLAVRGQARLEELHDLVYGERSVTLTTVRAELSHLRHLLGGRVGSRPYQLDLPLRVDLIEVLDAVARGDVATAMAGYRGPLLPYSESPFIVDLRHQLDARLRALVLQRGTPDQLVRLASIHPFDVEVLERAAALTPGDDPLHAEIAVRSLSALGG